MIESNERRKSFELNVLLTFSIFLNFSSFNILFITFRAWLSVTFPWINVFICISSPNLWQNSWNSTNVSDRKHLFFSKIVGMCHRVAWKLKCADNDSGWFRKDSLSLNCCCTAILNWSSTQMLANDFKHSTKISIIKCNFWLNPNALREKRKLSF